MELQELHHKQQQLRYTSIQDILTHVLQHLLTAVKESRFFVEQELEL